MITFENLWWLLLLPLPLIIRKWLPPVIVKYDSGLKTPFFTSLLAINKVSQKTSTNWRLKVGFLTWFFLLLAASGPQWLGKVVDLPRSGRDILLAIDLSSSMNQADMEINNDTVNRLTVVKGVARQFVKDRKGDRIGLILFATQAYLQTPLTFDLKTVSEMLLDSTVGLAGTQTAIGDAIGLAIKHFKKYPNDNKVLILLTDGVNTDGKVSPLEAAKIAAKYGIRIYTVGLSGNQIMADHLTGASILSLDNDLDEKTLKEIANQTHGIYFRAKDPQELINVYQQLDKIEPRLGEKETFRPKTPLYYWPLGVALGLVMMQLLSVIRIKGFLPLNATIQRIFTMRNNRDE